MSEYDDSAESRVSGVKSGRRQDLKSVATYQKVILVCILIYLLAVVFQFTIPPDLRFVLGLVVLPALVVATVFVFLLATKVYSTGVGVLLGLLTLIPCIGLLVLLVINSKATGILRENGIDVGLLGADLSQI